MVLERRQAGRVQRHVQETRVERQVVRHQDGVAQEVQEAGQHIAHGRLPVDHGRRDAGEPRDAAGHVAAGVDELLERLALLAALQAHRADLDQRVARRARPGGLGVDDDEGGVFDAQANGGVSGGVGGTGQGTPDR